MSEITASVGKGGANRRDDVAWVQTALIRHQRWCGLGAPLVVTGAIDPPTLQAITAFQGSAAALARPDGLVSPHGFTVRQLARLLIPYPANRVFAPVCWNRPGGALTQAEYDSAAASLGCQAAAIQAVAQTETMRAAWDDLGRPTILYERHYFSRLSNHRFDATHHDISSRIAYRRGAAGVSAADSYGPASGQYPRLLRAAILDENAALQSASWGLFQIMGANYAACGFDRVDDFVNAMATGEARQLAALVTFIGGNAAMKRALQQLDWARFASIYNGPDYADNEYDTKMARAYAALVPRAAAGAAAAPAPAAAPRR
jgi:hypothetical protein